MLKRISLFSLILLTGCTNPVAWWKSVNTKAKHLASLEARHEALEQAYERLQREHYELEHSFAELQAKVQSEDLAKVNLAATGSLTGRHPASIVYKVPNGLKPEEMRTLAYEHLREQRFGEAAVTFTAFLDLPEAAPLADANDMYSCGVAWFQVGNFKKSREQLTAAREHASGETKEKVRKKVDLWLRVIDRKLASSAPHGG